LHTFRKFGQEDAVEKFQGLLFKLMDRTWISEEFSPLNVHGRNRSYARHDLSNVIPLIISLPFVHISSPSLLESEGLQTGFGHNWLLTISAAVKKSWQ